MNNFAADTLLRAFPCELARKPAYLLDQQAPLVTAEDYKDLSKASKIALLAAIVAEEIEDLSAAHDLALLYGRIDALDGTMLDILAYDFKVDWWDANATLEQKREVFKNHFIVHRTLGTIGSISRALKDMYESARIIEWPEYNGRPYHYKLYVDLGEAFALDDVFSNILYRTRFYTNVRSVLELIRFDTTRKLQLYCGVALQYGEVEEYFVEGLRERYIVLTDENGIPLMDQDEHLLLANSTDEFEWPATSGQETHNNFALYYGSETTFHVSAPEES